MIPKTLRISLFHLPPFVLEHQHPNGSTTYSGLEVEMFRELAHHHGYGISFTSPTDGAQWGSVDEKNLSASTGLMGQLLRDETDIGIGGSWIEFGASEVGRSVWYDMDEVGFLLKREQVK